MSPGIPGRSPCPSVDSPTPITCNGIIVEGQWVLTSAAYKGEGCGQPLKYGVYTRVSSYVD